jgi:hypothetical protein
VHDSTDDHYFNANWVGQQTREEVLENYYRTSVFRSTSLSDNFNHFLTTDRWHLGFEPVSLISKLELCYTLRDSRVPGPNILDHIESLLKLKRGARIMFKINFIYTFAPWLSDNLCDDLKEILRVFCPLVVHLVEACYRVTFDIGNKMLSTKKGRFTVASWDYELCPSLRFVTF